MNAWNALYLLVATVTGLFALTLTAVAFLSGRGTGRPVLSISINTALYYGQWLAVVEVIIFLGWLVVLLPYSLLARAPGTRRTAHLALTGGLLFAGALVLAEVAVMIVGCSFIGCSGVD